MRVAEIRLRTATRPTTSYPKGMVFACSVPNYTQLHPEFAVGAVVGDVDGADGHCWKLCLSMLARVSPELARVTHYPSQLPLLNSVEESPNASTDDDCADNGEANKSRQRHPGIDVPTQKLSPPRRKHKRRNDNPKPIGKRAASVWSCGGKWAKKPDHFLPDSHAELVVMLRYAPTPPPLPKNEPSAYTPAP